MAIKKHRAVTQLVRPVRPPAPMPEALSTNVVVLDVPKMAPTDVAMESANRALSILDLKPELEAMVASSSSEKMPLRRPVPMKVPMVSNVSDRLKAKIVIRTRGRRAASENSAGNPCVNAAPKVVPSCVKESLMPCVKLMPERSTTPMGMPRMVVATMPMRMAPFTFSTSRITVSTRPIRNRSTEGVFSVTMAGVAAEEATTVPDSASV